MTNVKTQKEVVCILTTEANLQKAKYLANRLLCKHYAACVSFKEIESHFWWEGKLHESKEIQLLIKTNKDKLKVIHKEIKEIHSYENPEIIFWMASGSKAYVEWIDEVVSFTNIV